MKAIAHKTVQYVAAKQKMHDGVQLKRRPGVGNHHRTDRLERQADDIASRVLAGGTGLARRITPTKTAGFTLPTSSGRPLYDDLRTELENSFGADFSAVRIHSDSHSGHAAEEHGAKAFTSGRDIFFAEENFKPATREGKRLLAHELTHVLQQTGRAGADGRRHATDVQGSGEVQCVDMLDIVPLTQLHRPKTGTSGADYTSIAAELQKITHGVTDWKNDPDVASKFESFTWTKPVKEWPAEAESLYFDLLKSVGKTDAATKLLLRDDGEGAIRIQTSLFNTVVSRKALADGLLLVPKIWNKIPVIKHYWQREFFRIIEYFIFQRWDQDVPVLYGRDEKNKLRTLKDHDVQLKKDMNDPKVLGPNEFSIGMFNSLLSLDRQRVEKLTALRADAEKKRTNDYERRVELAWEIVNWGKNIAPAKDVTGDMAKATAVFADAYSARIVEIGERAARTLERAIATSANLIELFKTGASTEAILEQHPLTPFLKEKAFTGAIKGLQKLLLTQTVELFKPGAVGELPPDEKDYLSRAENFAEKLNGFATRELDNKIATLFTQSADVVNGVVFVKYFLQLVAINLARAYETDATVKVTGSDLDYRVAHRIWTARIIERLAIPLGWTDVAAECKKVLDAQMETKSVLAILTDYRDENLELDAMRTKLHQDFDIHMVIEGFEPLTAGALTRFFYAEYYRKLNSHLAQLLPSRNAPIAVDDPKAYKSILGEAQERAAKLPLPVRWSVPSSDVEIAWKPGDSDFDGLVERHPKTTALQTQIKAGGMEWVMPVNPRSEVFLWSIPSILTLVQHLRKIPSLNTAVAEEQYKVNRDDMRRPQDLALGEWWNFLHSHYTRPVKEKGLDETGKNNLVVALMGGLLDQRAKAHKDLQPSLREATTHHRRVMVKLQMKPMLEAFEDNHIKYSSVPTALAQSIEFFRLQVSPKGTEKFQSAALLLEIANELEDAFEYERGYSVINAWYGLIDEALIVAAGQGDELKRLYLRDDEKEAEWFTEAVSELKEIHDDFDKARRNVQSKYGFYTSKDPEELQSLNWSSAVSKYNEKNPDANNAFAVDGKTYALIAVYREFTYHPSYGKEPIKGFGTDSSAYLPPKFLDKDGKPLDLPQDEVLLEINIDGTTIPVTPKHTTTLDQIDYAVSMYGFQESMGNLASVLNTFGEALLFAAELIPGVGAAAAMAQLTGAIAAFWADKDWEDVKKLFGEDMQRTLEDVWEDIQNAMTPGNLLLFLMFGSPTLTVLMSRFPEEEDTKKVKKPVVSKPQKFKQVRAVVKGVKKLGKGLHKAMEGLQDKVQTPANAFQGYVAVHPAVAFAIRFAANHLSVLSTLKNLDVSKIPMSEKELLDALGLEQKGMTEKVHAIVDGVRGFELPKDVIRFEPVISLVVAELLGFILKRLGAKGQVLKPLMEKTGLMKMVSDRIAVELVHAGLDPNIYWREKVVPQIQGKFDGMKTDLVSSLNSTLGHPVFGGKFDKIPNPPAVTIAMDETAEGFPETQAPTEDTAVVMPMPDGTKPFDPEPEDIPAVRGGAPLTDLQRKDLETRFGHDLGHVRLHTGEAAGPMTGAFAAKGVTTGSHVYLKPGLAPEGGPGRDVLLHELTHVLQQTGPRPVGKRHDQAPVAGGSHKRLQYDRVQESAARRGAEMARRQPEGPVEPVAFGSEQHERSFQPLLDEFVLYRVLKNLSDVEEVKREAEARIGVKQIDPEIQRLVDAFRRVALNPSTNIKLVNIRKSEPFSDPECLLAIETRLSNLEGIGNMLRSLALEAMTDAKDRTATPALGAKPPKIEYLHPLHFAHLVEGYIFGKTGIRMVYDLTKAKDTRTDENALDPKSPIASIEIRGIHLPFIGGTADLWKLVMKNTWPKESDVERAELQGVVRDYIGSNQVLIGIWDSGSKYKFNDAFKALIEAAKVATKEPILEAKYLPTWQNYIKKDAVPEPAPGLGQIGLRRGLFKDKTQAGTERESHHATQFLLVEYFHNVNDQKAFATGLDYPGVVWEDVTKTKVKNIRKPGSTSDADALQVNSAFTGRGGLMPAILLARETHRNADLHVTPTPDDIDKTTKKKTQGNTINNWFENRLPTELVDAKRAVDRTAHLAAIGKLTKPVVHEKIYAAAVGTYHHMRDFMINQLKNNAPAMEVAYFKRKWEEHHAPKTLDAATELSLAGGVKDSVKAMEGETKKAMLDQKWPE